ncbi:hypothetical protein Patl1_36997 [Pistacia atlantica]|nr:hypothetical protein Patl1_36997 [Pistacia atlantica]
MIYLGNLFWGRLASSLVADIWSQLLPCNEVQPGVQSGYVQPHYLDYEESSYVYKGFEGLKVLVDVGGGIGVTLDVITSKYPHIKGINFDLPHVLAEAPTYSGVKHGGGDINGTYHASADEEKVMTRKQKAENKTHDNGNGKTNGKAGESDVIDVEFEEFCKAVEANLSIEQMVEWEQMDIEYAFWQMLRGRQKQDYYAKARKAAAAPI